MSTHLRLQYLAVILLVAGCTIGFPKYTIGEVTSVLYDEGLICSTDLNYVDYPTGIKAYILRVDDVCLEAPGNHAYHGRIEIYPTRAELRRVTQQFAQTMSIGSLTYSEFIKGNVVIVIFPSLPEEDSEKFRAALNQLGK